MENKNTSIISGLDNILSTSAFVSLVAVLISGVYLAFDTAYKMHTPALEYVPLVVSHIPFAVSIFFSIVLTGVMWSMHKRYADDLSKWDSSLQRVYLHVFLFTAIVIGVIVALGGLSKAIELALTLENVIDGIALLFVSAFLFLYARYRLYKGVKSENFTKVSQYFLGSLLTAVVVVLVAHVAVLGSPSLEAKQQNDLTRIYDLDDLQSEIIYQYQTNGVLPESLSAMDSYYVALFDPITKEPYEYSIDQNNPLKFEVCATFQASAEADNSPMSMMYKDSLVTQGHKAGRACFDKTIDTEKYAPFSDNSYNEECNTCSYSSEDYGYGE